MKPVFIAEKYFCIQYCQKVLTESVKIFLALLLLPCNNNSFVEDACNSFDKIILSVKADQLLTCNTNAPDY